ncbi:hypothetical protein CR513_24490, partial [Mucuna pruriens]
MCTWAVDAKQITHNSVSPAFVYEVFGGWKGRNHPRPRPQPTKDLKEIQIGADPYEKTKIGASLKEEVKKQLVRFLFENRDIFAWFPEDMPGIDPYFMCHHLSISPRTRPMSQKKRKLGEEKRKSTKEKINKLLAVHFIIEV